MAERAETGPVQFGDDWPGVFIRGDNAHHYALIIERLLQAIGQGFQESIDRTVLQDLAQMLRGSSINSSAAKVQLRPFGECIAGETPRHVWVPLSEAGELKDGLYVCRDAFWRVDVFGWRDGRWLSEYGPTRETITHVLSPDLGPISEGP